MKLGVYQHHTGKLYKVIGLALHTETREKMVIYKALYRITDFRDLDEELGTDPYFVRPQKMFLKNFKPLTLIPMHLKLFKTGLVLGLFISLMHLLWLFLIAIGIAQPIMDFIFKVHMLNNPFTIQPLDLLNAILLLVVTFVVGFIVGIIFALIFNMLHRK